MIDKYIILNRKPNNIIKIFIIIIIFLTGIVIWGINNFTYQKYLLVHSQILNLNSYYYLEVLIPAKEVNQITKQNSLWINQKKYTYRILKIDNNIIFQNQENYIKVNLEINNLEKKYQVNGYHLDIKFKKKSKKIIEYLKNEEELNE